MPVFMKAECNRCHGAARGQDGFRLSLWGFDPEGDHYRLTRELPGRRINLAMPEESMLLTKADGEAPHTGGKLFREGQRAVQDPPPLARSRRAERSRPTWPSRTSLELLPKKLVLESPGQNFKITVRAHYSDGTDRDVTDTALFLTSNEGSAKIGRTASITTGPRGEAFVMARFATFTVGAQVIVIPKGLKYEWPKVEERNFVDQLVDEKLQNLRITPERRLQRRDLPAPRLHRHHRHCCPTRDEVTKFVADTGSAEARRRRSTNCSAAANSWTSGRSSGAISCRSAPASNNQGSYKATLTYYTWLRDQFDKNVPMNEIARAAHRRRAARISKIPAVNYYQLETDPLKLAEDTAQAFFGIRIQCSQCHNHPFDRWTMEDYRGFVAFFTQIGRKNGEDPRETIIFNSGSGESQHPVGNRVVPPKFLGGDAPGLQGQGPPPGARRLGRLAGESLFPAPHRQPHLGAIHGPRHRRAGG